jgi:zinc transport system permease protein
MTTLSSLLSLLAEPFIQRAFLVGIIVAVASSVLGVFIVLKKISLIGDGLAHTAFGGLALGYYLDVVPLWAAAVVVVLGAIGITKSTRSKKISGDAAVAVILQLGLASGIVLLSLARGFGVNIDSLLFGSILLVDYTQILVAGVVLALILGVVIAFYKELQYATFDEAQARASGINTSLFDYLVSVLAGIVVIASIPIVGVLLISAMIVLPALMSLQVSGSFRRTLLLSPVFGTVSVVVGMLLSIVLDTASGATIVLTAILGLILILGFKRISATPRQRATRPSLQQGSP